MIHFACPSCQQKYNVPDDKAGVKARCKKCGAVMQVPAPAPAAAAADGGFELDEPVASASPAPRRTAPRMSTRGAAATVGGRPLTGVEEVAKRRRAFMILGIALIVGFILPAVGPGGRLTFPNMENLGSAAVPLFGKLMLIYPLLAGIAVLVLAQTMLPPARGAVIAIIGAFPILASLLQPESMQSMQQFGSQLAAIGMMIVLLYLGLCGVIIGARARWYRPTMAHAAIIGIIGGVMLCLFFVIPIEGQMAIAAPFQMMRASVFGGLGVLIAFGLVIASAVLCFMNPPATPPDRAVQLAHLSTRCLAGAAVILPATIVLLGIVSMFTMGGGVGEMLLVLVTMAKVICAGFGMFLLLPLGISDALVDHPQTNPNACPACGYDLSGSTGDACPECGQAV